ncbi:MAG: SRPBCC family protein [Nannocystaceae bacterium]|nr:SRPBCC family protein [Nannocystaceae bacterium]
MKVTIATYHRLAKFVGVLLMLMGVGLAAAFLSFLWTGATPLAQPPLSLNGAGLLVFATVGAFAFPLGVSLLSTDSATSARLRIAAWALGLMALLRLAAFADADIRALVGITALIEFFVLGGIGLVAYVVRPENESPINIRMSLELDVPAAEVWRVLGERFGNVGDYAAGVQSSSMDGEVGVGAVRTCTTQPFGPFAAAKITEELTEFDPAAMKFTYLAGGDLPRMIPTSKNRWSVEALGSERCRVQCHASVDLLWWALPLAQLLGWGIRSEVLRFGEDLRYRVENGTPHPRKLAALGAGS